MGVVILREADWYTAGSEYRNPGVLAVIPARATSRIEALGEGIIEAGWLLALGLVPLLFNIYSSRNYEPDKVALLRSLAVVMVTHGPLTPVMFVLTHDPSPTKRPTIDFRCRRETP